MRCKSNPAHRRAPGAECRSCRRGRSRCLGDADKPGRWRPLYEAGRDVAPNNPAEPWWATDDMGYSTPQPSPASLVNFGIEKALPIFGYCGARVLGALRAAPHWIYAAPHSPAHVPATGETLCAWSPPAG